MDYVVVKFPKWPLTSSTGPAGSWAPDEGHRRGDVHRAHLRGRPDEGRPGAEIKLDSLHYQDTTGRSLDERLASMDDLRIFTIFEALSQGVSIDHIHEITRIDRFFIHKLQNLVRFEEELKAGLTPEKYLQAKKYGYPDKAIARLAGVDGGRPPPPLPQLQDGGHLRRPSSRPRPPISTPPTTTTCDARHFPRSGRETVIVLGSGPIRIGQHRV